MPAFAPKAGVRERSSSLEISIAFALALGKKVFCTADPHAFRPTASPAEARAIFCSNFKLIALRNATSPSRNHERKPVVDSDRQAILLLSREQALKKGVSTAAYP